MTTATPRACASPVVAAIVEGEVEGEVREPVSVSLPKLEGPELAALVDCNTAVLPVGAALEAKCQMFYSVKYLSKNPVELKECPVAALPELWMEDGRLL